jgi:hypothetical protein
MKRPGVDEFSSRSAVFFIQAAYLGLLGAFVICYRADWLFHPRSDFFGSIPFLVPWFGAVGAVLLSLKGVFDHPERPTNNPFPWDPSTRYWHWSRPVVGAIVATVTILIFQSGILAVGGKPPNEVSGRRVTENLLYYVLAFVVGYREESFRELIKKLADTIFTSPDSAPPTAPDGARPSGAGESAQGTDRTTSEDPPASSASEGA